MLSRTSLSAIRLLLHLGQLDSGQNVSPKRVAQQLGESPTYLAKVAGILVKTGILRAGKGVKGGVQLGQPPEQVTLLAVVEACQGAIVGGYCQGTFDPATTCAYHRAAVELRSAIVEVLSRWTLARLLERPYSPVYDPFSGFSCEMMPAHLRPKSPPEGGLIRLSPGPE